MSDNILNAMSSDLMVRVVVADTTAAVEKARSYHALFPTGTILLGRLLTAASIMGSDLKEPDASVTLRLDGSGPVRTAIAVSDGLGWCRGCLDNRYVSLPPREDGSPNVGAAVGKGSLTVIKDINLKEPYVGRVELVSGEIAEDVTRYLYDSEQTPGVCSLGVLLNEDCSVRAAGGFILSLMPGADESVIERVEADIAALPPMTKMLADGMTTEDIARLALKSDFGSVTRTIPCGYRCTCSRERTEQILLSLGRKELERLAAEEDTVEVKCHFCDAVYRISAAELLKQVDAER